MRDRGFAAPFHRLRVELHGISSRLVSVEVFFVLLLRQRVTA
jgi:hypothetical protein